MGLAAGSVPFKQGGVQKALEYLAAAS